MRDFINTIKNFFSLSISELLGKVFSFIGLVYLARIITTESFGIIAFSTAFVTYFLLFVDLGFDVILVKKIANDNFVIRKYVNNVLSIKFINALVLFTLLFTVALFIDKSTVVKTSIIIFGFILFAQAGSLDFLFQGVEKFKYISYKTIGRSTLYLLLLLIFIKNDNDIYKVFLFMVLSAVIFTFWQYHKYKKKYIQYTFEIDKQFAKKLLKESYPLLISVIMATIYGNMDLVMLGFIKTNYEVGIYNASYKIFMLAILPFAVLLKIYLPILSRFSFTNKFKKSLLSFIATMIIMGCFILVPLFFLSGYLIEFIFGVQYLPAHLSLKILLADGMIVCMSMSVGNPLTVWGRQKYHALALSIGAIVNVVLNFIFIPMYSYNGAALATLISEASVFIVLMLSFVLATKNLFKKRLI